MTGFVGALRARLGLDTADFDRNLRGAQTRARTGLAGAFAAAGRLITPVTIGMAAAGAAVAAITAPAILAGRAIDEAAKAARRLDASFAGFQALRLAASEAGVNVDTLADQVQNLNTRLARPSPETANALAQLNLSAETLLGLDADARIAALADAVDTMGLSASETGAALRALGVEDRRMVNLIIGGSAAIRAARADIEDYGLALSDIDTAAIERGNDQMGRLTLVSGYLGQQLAAIVVPALGELAQGFTDSMRQGGGLRTVLDSYVIPAARTLVGWIMGTVRFVGNLGTAFGLLGEIAAGVWTGIVETARAIPTGLSGIWNGVRADFTFFLRDLVQKWADFLGGIAGGIPDFAIFDGMRESAEAAHASAVRLTDDLTGAGIVATMVANEARAAWSDAVSNGFAGARRAVADLTALFQGQADAAPETAEALERITEALDSVPPAAAGAAGGMRQVEQSTQDAAAAAGDWAQTMAGHFDGLITGGKSFSDVLQGMARQLETRAWQQLFEGLSGTRKPGGGGFLNFLTGLLMPGNARGTESWGGGLTWVGEEGPELVRLPTNARVYSAPESARMTSQRAAAQDVHVTVSAVVDERGTIVPVVQSVLQRATPGIVRQAVGATYQSFREVRPQ